MIEDNTSYLVQYYMKSILISLDPIVIRSFGFFMAMGVLSAFFLMKKLGKRINMTTDSISNFLLIVMFFSVIGARIAYVIEHWQMFKGDWVSIFKLYEGGIMFYGGFLGGIFGAVVYSLFTKRNIIEILDLSATVLPIGHAFGRIGCFMNGCCFGRVSDSWCAVSYPAGSNPWYQHLEHGLIEHSAARSLPILPSQLFESFLNFLICIILVYTFKKEKKFPGLQIALYSLMYSVTRYCVEMTRADERYHYGVLSISQMISIGLFIFGLVVLLYVGYNAWRKRKANVGMVE